MFIIIRLEPFYYYNPKENNIEMTLKSGFLDQKWPYWDPNMFFSKSKIFSSERHRKTEPSSLVSYALENFYYNPKANNFENDPKISILGPKMATLVPKFF